MESGNKGFNETEVFKDFIVGFKTSYVCMNAVAFFCILQPQENAKDIELLKYNLRKSLLEISDGLSKVGLPLPIYAIIECKDKQDQDKKKEEISDYNKWHEIAGDQDWHRGDFLIVPCRGGNDAKEIFEQLRNPILGSELTYTYKTFTLKDFAKYFEGMFGETQTRTTIEEHIKSLLYKELSNKLKNSSLEQSKAVDEALDSWRNEINKMIEMPEIDKNLKGD